VDEIHLVGGEKFVHESSSEHRIHHPQVLNPPCLCVDEDDASG
jgi:hypothetical protein